MPIEKESLEPVEEEKEPITEREKEIKDGALLSVLEAAEIRWKERSISVEEIEDDIGTEEEINEELREKKIPVKRSQIKEVRESRQEMVRLEAEYNKYKTLTGQIGKIFKKEEKTKIKEEYDRAKDKYNETQNELLRFYVEKAQDRWTGKEGKAKFEKFRNEVIFRGNFGREQERINQAKQEVLSKQDKGRFRKILGNIGQEYSKIPKGRRWVYTALLGTGAAFGVGAIAAPAALGYATFRFGRAAFASSSAFVIKGIGDKLEKLWLEEHGKEKREEKIKESLSGQMEQVNEFEQMSKLLILMLKREERDKELAKLAKAQKYWQVGKVAAMIGAGGGIAFCAGQFDMFGPNKVAAEVCEKLGVEEGGKVIRMPIVEEEVEAGVSEVQERVAAIPQEVAEAESFEIAEKVDIKRGDSIWSVAEKYLKGNTVYREIVEIGDKDMAEALRTYNINRVKNAIVADPQAYRLPAGVDVDKLTIGQLKGIDWEKAFADAFPEGKGLTDGLTPEQVDSIVENNKALRTFFQKYQDAPRTSDNYEAILKGKGITGEVTETEKVVPIESDEEIVETKKVAPIEPAEEVAEAKKVVPIEPDEEIVEAEKVVPIESDEEIVEAEKVLPKIDVKDFDYPIKISEEASKIIKGFGGKIYGNKINMGGISDLDITESTERVSIDKFRENSIKVTVHDKDGSIHEVICKNKEFGKVKTLVSAEAPAPGKEASLPITEAHINKARISLIEDYKITLDEVEVTLNAKVGDLLTIPKNWTEAAQGDYEKKYWKLANDIRASEPSPEEMEMTIKEYLAKIEAKVDVEEAAKEVGKAAKDEAVNIELKE